jgi:hypothetical protein
MRWACFCGPKFNRLSWLRQGQLQNGAKISIGKLHLGKEKEWEACQQNINGKDVHKNPSTAHSILKEMST